MSECSVCTGNGYILDNHLRRTCPKCGGRGTSNKIIGLGIYAKNTETYITAKTASEKRDAIEDKIDALQEEIEEKESAIEDLADEISCLESQIRKLRVKIVAV